MTSTPQESWLKNPAWWAIVVSLVLSVGTLAFQLFGEAIRGYFGTSSKVDKLESRIENIERNGKLLDELNSRIAAQLAELEGVKRSLEVLKRDLVPFSTGDILPFRLNDRDKLSTAARDVATLNRQIESLDRLTAMHTEQLGALRDMLKALAK